MGKFAVSIIIGLVMFASSTAQAAPQRMSLAEGERVGLPVEGDWCWDFHRTDSGRVVAVIKAGHQVPGTQCRGERLWRVRLPEGTHEDSVRVWRTEPRYVAIWVMTADR